jgi:hypothetical protein
MRYVDIYTAFRNRMINPDEKIHKKATVVLSNLLNYKDYNNLNYSIFINTKLRHKIYINISDYDGCVIEFKEYDTKTSAEYNCAFINIKNDDKDISFLAKSNIISNAVYKDSVSDYEIDFKSIFCEFIARKFLLKHRNFLIPGFENFPFENLINKIIDDCLYNSVNTVYEYFDQYKVIKLTNEEYTVTKPSKK